jgi:hypothetical protein
VVSTILVLLSLALGQAATAQAALFDTETACPSPHGDVEEDCKAIAPDGTQYAQVVQPQAQRAGAITIFAKSGQQLTTITIPAEAPNPIKGIAWGPDSRRLAVMYHHGDPRLAPGYLAIVDAKSGAVLDKVRWQNNTFYQYLRWEGTHLKLSHGGGQVEEQLDLAVPIVQQALFDTDTACASPHGDVADGCKAKAPNGSRYAQVVQPKGQPAQAGHLLIFDAKPGSKPLQIQLPEEVANPIKGVAWGPDNQRLAVMYHHGAAGLAPGFVAIVNATDGALLDKVRIKAWHHYMVWEGTQLKLSTGGLQEDEVIHLP